MKNTGKAVLCLLLALTCMAGCSSKDADKEKNEVNKTTKTTEKKSNEAREKVSDSIDNVMTYFKNEGLKFENSQVIKNMDFAAHEGRSFTVNGKTAYLYRVNSDDENMKKVLKAAKDSGEIKVNIDNKEQMYGARVNGDFLLLYDTSADMNDMLTAFPNYRASGVQNPGNTQTTTKSNTTNNQANTKDE